MSGMPFSKPVHVSPPEFSFILTNNLSQNDAADVAWFVAVAAMAAMAAGRGPRLVLELSRIEPEEDARRFIAADLR